MRGVMWFLTAAAVIALAFWAYRETHATQQAKAELRQLQRDIARLNEALAVQRAEWAFLNRPDRLRELVELNFGRLMLMPMMPEQFGRIDEVSFPPPPPLLPQGLGLSVETIATLSAEEEPL